MKLLPHDTLFWATVEDALKAHVHHVEHYFDSCEICMFEQATGLIVVVS